MGIKSDMEKKTKSVIKRWSEEEKIEVTSDQIESLSKRLYQEVM